MVDSKIQLLLPAEVEKLAAHVRQSNYRLSSACANNRRDSGGGILGRLIGVSPSQEENTGCHNIVNFSAFGSLFNGDFCGDNDSAKEEESLMGLFVAEINSTIVVESDDTENVDGKSSWWKGKKKRDSSDDKIEGKNSNQNTKNKDDDEDTNLHNDDTKEETLNPSPQLQLQLQNQRKPSGKTVEATTSHTTIGPAPTPEETAQTSSTPPPYSYPITASLSETFSLLSFLPKLLFFSSQMTEKYVELTPKDGSTEPLTNDLLEWFEREGDSGNLDDIEFDAERAAGVPFDILCAFIGVALRGSFEEQVAVVFWLLGTRISSSAVASPENEDSRQNNSFTQVLARICAAESSSSFAIEENPLLARHRISPRLWNRAVEVLSRCPPTPTSSEPRASPRTTTTQTVATPATSPSKNLQLVDFSPPSSPHVSPLKVVATPQSLPASSRDDNYSFSTPSLRTNVLFSRTAPPERDGRGGILDEHELNSSIEELDLNVVSSSVPVSPVGVSNVIASVDAASGESDDSGDEKPTNDDDHEELTNLDEGDNIEHHDENLHALWNYTEFLQHMTESNFPPGTLLAIIENILSLPHTIIPRRSLERKIFLDSVCPGCGHLSSCSCNVGYVVEKGWFDRWRNYTADSTEVDGLGNKDGSSASPRLPPLPPPIMNHLLISGSEQAVLPGSLGSVEWVREGLQKNIDYVVLTRGGWEYLFDRYAGGPPLPRLRTPSPIFGEAPRPTNALGELDTSLILHPHVLEVYSVDTQQPYRRGHLGDTSIHLQTTADTLLQNLIPEILDRCPASPDHYDSPRNSQSAPHSNSNASSNSNTSNNNNRSNNNNNNNNNNINNDQQESQSSQIKRRKVRLWKESVNPTDHKALGNFGPWELVKKGSLVVDANSDEIDIVGYCGDMVVGPISRLLVEYNIIHDENKSSWPRSAAARFGEQSRLIQAEKVFRRRLKGFDSDSERVDIVGEEVDASDRRGGWTRCVVVEAVENEEGNGNSRVKIDFGDGLEWIGVDSDRLAVKGRYCSSSESDTETSPDNINDASSDASSEASSNLNNDPRSSTRYPTPTRKKLNGGGKKNSDLGGGISPFPGYGACGLMNLGNTCYANSAMQCISYLPLLRGYLLSKQFHTNKHLNSDNPLGSGGVLLESFADLIKNLWSSHHAYYAPKNFRRTVATFKSQFSGGEQQDAQEFLLFLYDTFHEDLNRVTTKPLVPPISDDFASKETSSRVGEEAWRRFVRRNMSVVSSTIMGQILNMTTCPKCGHISRNFDPFSMLSLPIPSVTEVTFRITVFRRATAHNLSDVLTVEESLEGNRKRANTDSGPPSKELICEKYAIALPRLSDMGDLKLHIQNLTGIKKSRLQLVEAMMSDCPSSHSSGSPSLGMFVNNAELSDKESCTEVHARFEKEKKIGGIKVRSGKNVSPNNNTEDASSELSISSELSHMIAFEQSVDVISLSSVVPGHKNHTEQNDEEENEAGGPEIKKGRGFFGWGKRADNKSSDCDNNDDESNINDTSRQNGGRVTALHQAFEKSFYDEAEGRIYDTDMDYISKKISNRYWPTKESDFMVGLRVDGCDQRNNFFTGSVTSIFKRTEENNGNDDVYNSSDEETGEKNGDSMVVKVHFDRFGSKWDQEYTLEDFQDGRILPLFTNTKMRAKTALVKIYNRRDTTPRDRKDGVSDDYILFGLAFNLHLVREWSTARAGAHALSQIARFVKCDDAVAKAAIKDVVDILLDADRAYMRVMLSEEGMTNEKSLMINSDLKKALKGKLGKMPFVMTVCAAANPTPKDEVDEDVHEGQKNAEEDDGVEEKYSFALNRTIGNLLNSRLVIVFHWKKQNGAEGSSMEPKKRAYKCSYEIPAIHVHQQSEKAVKAKEDAKKQNPDNEKESESNNSNIPVPLSACFDEYCKENVLSPTDCWICFKCSAVRAGRQSMKIKRTPDLLTIHLKRFNCSIRWREKIRTRVDFPITGLDLSKWVEGEGNNGDYIYDLVGVVNHLGGMTGGHYVSAVKASRCSSDGVERVAHSFPSHLKSEEPKVVAASVVKKPTKLEMKNARLLESMRTNSANIDNAAEPLWLLADDDSVHPLSTSNIVTEGAYCLFYRKRNLSASSIAKLAVI